MANRKRPIRVRTYLTEEELKMVHKRMAQMGTTNREAYMRKMALDGYILRLEIPELKEYVAMQRVHSKRFNEIAKRVNETGRLYPEDVAEMKEMISKSTAQMELVLAEVNKLKYAPVRCAANFTKIVSGAWGLPKQESTRGPHGALLAKYVYLRRQENALWSPSCPACYRCFHLSKRTRDIWFYQKWTLWCPACQVCF